MQQEKGQVQIILFIIMVVGVAYLFFTYSKPEKQTTPIIPQNTPPAVSSSVSPNTTPSPVIPVVDNYPPYRSNGQPSGSLSAATREVTISLTTDEKAVCRYDTVSGVGYSAMKIFSSTNSSFHYTPVTGLNEGAGYIYYIKCMDERGNVNIDDFIIYFSVVKPSDLTPPVRSNQYPTGDIFPSFTREVTIGVSTNEPASCRYSWNQGVAYDSMANSLALADGTGQYHTTKITGLTPGNSYGCYIRCKDASGNVNTGDVMVSFSVAP